MSSELCSAWSGIGRWSAIGCSARPSILPSGPNTPARALPVPTSTAITVAPIMVMLPGVSTWCFERRRSACRSSLLGCLVVRNIALAHVIATCVVDGRQPKGLRLAEMLGNGALLWNDQRVDCGFGSLARATEHPESRRFNSPGNQQSRYPTPWRLGSVRLFAPRNSQAAAGPLCELGEFPCSCRYRATYHVRPAFVIRMAAVS